MSKFITTLCQIDPRFVRFSLFILFGILAPIVINQCPDMPGGIGS